MMYFQDIISLHGNTKSTTQIRREKEIKKSHAHTYEAWYIESKVVISGGRIKSTLCLI